MTWLAALAGAALPATAGAQGPMGAEFLMNDYTTGDQLSPAVTSDGTGDFVAVWYDERNEGDIVGRRFDIGGAPLGPEFRINTTAGEQTEPAIAATAPGSFVVVWTTFMPGGGAYHDVVGRLFGPGGAFGSEFAVNTYTHGDQRNPEVSVAADGSFVVVWASQFQDGGHYGIFAQRFDATGMPRGGEFQVNTYTTFNQVSPAVASRADGGFVVVWQGPDNDIWGIFGQLFDAGGMPQGPEFPINTYQAGFQRFPAVAADPGGNFVVVWESINQDGSGAGVFGRRFDAGSLPLGTEFQVNTFTTNTQTFPAVAMDRDGSFLVSWAGYAPGGGQGIFSQRYDSLGNPSGGERPVNTYTTGARFTPDVATVAPGEFVVAWESDGQDGSFWGVFGRRHGDLIFRDGFE
jgi:hypothetical protein